MLPGVLSFLDTLDGSVWCHRQHSFSVGTRSYVHSQGSGGFQQSCSGGSDGRFTFGRVVLSMLSIQDFAGGVGAFWRGIASFSFHAHSWMGSLNPAERVR
ncbi:unnamed protein product [Ectocarpus sp. 8 AP-2014]